MIEIINMNSGEAHVFFELLRIYFPYYENNESLLMEKKELDKKIFFQISFPNKVFLKELNKFESEGNYRHLIAEWIIKEISDPHKVDSSWGILTGIRPIKFVQKLRKNFNDKIVRKKLLEEYFLSDQLIDLLMDVSVLESKLTKGLNPNGYSLYINIPFCPSRCHYCSYPTIKSNNKEAISLYMKKMLEELISTMDLLEGRPDTIYIGGGTPTSIPLNELEELLLVLEMYAEGCEFTVEAGRPDTLDKETLSLLSSFPINRISINPQTMVNSTLERMGRQHSVEDIIEVYEQARNISDWDINMDLILGLPGEQLKDLEYSLSRIFSLDPENITVHTLSLKNGSKLFERELVDFHDVKDLENYSYKSIVSKGYRPYYMYRQKRILGNGMNIGYSKENHESIYNMLMMEELQTVIGIGMSSTTKILDSERDSCNKFSNFRNLKDYDQRFNEIIDKKRKFLKGLF